jgi:hypothetical protein
MISQGTAVVLIGCHSDGFRMMNFFWLQLSLKFIDTEQFQRWESSVSYICLLLPMKVELLIQDASS